MRCEVQSTLISMNASMLTRTGVPLVRRCLRPQTPARGCRTPCVLHTAA